MISAFRVLLLLVLIFNVMSLVKSLENNISDHDNKGTESSDSNVRSSSLTGRFPFPGLKLRRSAPSFSVAGVVLAGGVSAYMKKGSKPSLIGSLALGSGLITGGVLLESNQDHLGTIVSTAASAGVAAIGGIRFKATKKIFPAVPLLVLGAASTAFHIHHLWQGETVESKDKKE